MKILNHMFWSLESKCFEREPQEQIFFFFFLPTSEKLILKSVAGLGISYAKFSFRREVWGLSGALNNIVFSHWL